VDGRANETARPGEVEHPLRDETRALDGNANPRVFLHDQHVVAVFGQSKGGGATRGPPTDHEDIGPLHGSTRRAEP